MGSHPFWGRKRGTGEIWHSTRCVKRKFSSCFVAIETIYCTHNLIYFEKVLDGSRTSPVQQNLPPTNSIDKRQWQRFKWVVGCQTTQSSTMGFRCIGWTRQWMIPCRKIRPSSMEHHCCHALSRRTCQQSALPRSTETVSVNNPKQQIRRKGVDCWFPKGAHVVVGDCWLLTPVDIIVEFCGFCRVFCGRDHRFKSFFMVEATAVIVWILKQKYFEYLHTTVRGKKALNAPHKLQETCCQWLHYLFTNVPQ